MYVEHFHASMSLHSCRDIRITQTMPENSNAITLQVRGPQDSTFELTLYNLPTEITDNLESIFALPVKAD